MKRATKPCSHNTTRTSWRGLTVLVLAGLLASTGMAANEKSNPEQLAKLKSSGHCPRCRLAGVNLKGVELNYGKMSYAILSGSELDHAMLERVDLRFAQLEGASLQHAVLKHANLQGANMRGANFSFANLMHADLRNSDMRGANFQQANLKRAALNGAKLQGADLSTATGLNRFRLSSACGDKSTKLPNRLEIPECGSESENATEGEIEGEPDAAAAALSDGE
jgi:hypothetical protein